MCGIAGFYKKHSQVEPPYCLENVSSIQQSRGPDSIGEFVSSRGLVALYHQRLSIIDLSDSGKQPMTTQCLQCGLGIHLIYNGELYNYKELRSDLIKLGHNFFSSSDTEVIIHAYAEYGIEAFKKFNGVFSLALLDGRKKTFSETIRADDLIVVRGPIGVKPLYYTQNDAYFGFASELKTLLLDVNLSRDLDLDAINDYLTYLWCAAPRTPLKSVKKLEPGHFLIVRKGKIVADKQYYDIPVQPKNTPSNLNYNDFVAETKHKVEVAVQRQMVSDVPIGAFLSGGLDSSSIVACMRKIEPDIDIDCFTIKSKNEGSEGFASDFVYANKVARHLNVKLNTVEVGEDFYKYLPSMVYYLDEPQADPAPINAYLIAEKAKEMGYKVLMSGAGGDDIFTGYRRHYALTLEKYWQFLPNSVLKKLSSFSSNLNKNNKPFTRRFSKIFSHSCKGFDSRLCSYFDWSNEATRHELLCQNHTSSYSIQNSLGKLKNRNDISSLNQMLYLECKHFLCDHNLNYTDKMTMAQSIETRVPLLDLDLIKHAFTLPDKYKQKGNIGKYIFKKSMESYLPRDVIYRPKTGFGAPLRTWINGGMSVVIDNLLSESSIRSRGIFNYSAVKSLRQQNRLGIVDASYIILALFNIELWCRTFIDQSVPAIVDIF